MFVSFEKWHGACNDFIVVWLLSTDRDLLVPTFSRLAAKICSRNGSGVGADGILILVTKSIKTYDVEELVIVNADGSLAKNCGNGLRCAAVSVRKKAHSLGITDLDGVSLRVGDSIFDCRFLGAFSNPLVAVNMPTPKINEENSWHQEVYDAVFALQKKNPALAGDIATVEIANPHVVVFVKSVEKKLAHDFGASLQRVREGDGMNVHLASQMEATSKDSQRAKQDVQGEMSELYQVISYERGVGLTQACGSGACSVAVAVLNSGFVERDQWIAIDMPGGRLYVRQDQASEAVILAGEASFIFRGELEV